MTLTLTILAVVAIVVAPVVTYFVGVNRGKALGHEGSKAQGWLEYYEEQVRREKARHGKDGKFVAIKGKVNA
jgi:hypothetical protein